MIDDARNHEREDNFEIGNGSSIQSTVSFRAHVDRAVFWKQ
jgi:hypothetical protein